MRVLSRRFVSALMLLLVADVAWSGPSPAPGLEARLDRSLLGVLESAEPLEEAASAGYRVPEGRVQVMVVSHPSATGELVAWLERHDAVVVVAFRHLVRADVSPGLLADLAAHPAVEWVRKPLYPETPDQPWSGRSENGALSEVTTEGLAPMNGIAWHNAGLAGQGARVGIIDGGFGGYQALLGGELPASIRTHFRAFGSAVLDPNNVHGTACAEIIHDIAPDAELYLAMIEDLVTFHQAMEWLRDQGVAVVLNSTAWFFLGPGDGTSPTHDLIDEQVIDGGMYWAMGAGNYREQHWQGRSVDRDGDGWVEFDDHGTESLMLLSSDGRPRSFNSGDTINSYLIWNDWAAVNQDFDIRLFRVSGSQFIQVGSSNGTQNGGPGQAPAESLPYVVQSSGNYAVRVFRTNADAVHDMELFTPRRNLEHWIGAGSIDQPSDSRRVVAVAAGSHSAPYTTYSFSSQGPSNGPGGALDGGISKPDITAYAYVSTVSRGSQVFSGTSASGPHVAGAAALVWSARPTWSNLEVRRYLEHTAVDMGAPGCDLNYGCGRLYLGAPIAAAAECVAEVSPATDSVPAGGGSGTAVVVVGSGCPWFADSPTDWIHVVGSGAGSGNGTIAYTVDASPACVPRQGVLFAAGSSVAIAQDGNDPRTCPRRPSDRVLSTGPV